jgi:hypothetical protein
MHSGHRPEHSHRWRPKIKNMPKSPSTDRRPVARLFSDRAELLTAAGWRQRPLQDPTALNQAAVAVNDHLDAVGVEFVVAIKVSESTGRRRAWLMVPAADVDRAIGWPGTILS